MSSANVTNQIRKDVNNNCANKITRKQIMDCLNSYVKDYIVDAQWHIDLVKDFMFLLDGDDFDKDELINWDYIKLVIQNNKDKEYAKRVLMRKTPERYISALFLTIVNHANNVTN